jgi:hypothetical protein
MTGSFVQIAGTGAGSLIQAENPQQVPSFIWQEPRADSLIQAGKIEDRFLLTASRNRGSFFNTG